MSSGRAGAGAVRPLEPRGWCTLGLLAGLWLLGGVDLGMSVLATRYGLLSAHSECNPLAAIALSCGSWALLLYKVLLSAGGSVALVLYRRLRITARAAAGVLIVYALVVLNWILLYRLYAPFRDISLCVGDFCRAATQLGYVTAAGTVVVLGVAAIHFRQRRRYGDANSGWRVYGARGPLPIGRRVALACVLALILIPLSCSPGRPQPAYHGETPGGTIYFRNGWDTCDRLWCMNADGSDRTPLPVGVRGEPSRLLHGGHRWFLTVRRLPAGTYPDGRPRSELFAVRDDALSVRLTNQPDLEPAPLTPRWPIHAEDRVISWIARRWEPTGRVCDGGIYTATIVFDADGRPGGLAEQPREPLVRCALVLACENEPWWRARAPDIRSHDWSPAGTRIAYDTTQNELRIADVATARTARVTSAPAKQPAWSPDGTRIAFRLAEPLGRIAALRCTEPDGPTVVEYSSGVPSSVAVPTWSPTGTHLIYQAVCCPRPIEAPAEVDVWRIAANGTAPINLTTDIGGYLSPVAWR